MTWFHPLLRRLRSPAACACILFLVTSSTADGAFNYADILPALREEAGIRNPPAENLLGELTPAKRWNEIEAHDYRRHPDYLSADLAERVLDEDLAFLKQWASLDTEARYRRLEDEAFVYPGHYDMFEYGGFGMGPELYFGFGGEMRRPEALPLDPDGHRLMKMLALWGDQAPSDRRLKTAMREIVRQTSLASVEKASAISLRYPEFFEPRTLHLAYAAFAYGGHAHPIVSVAARARHNPPIDRSRSGFPEPMRPPGRGAPGGPPPGMDDSGGGSMPPGFPPPMPSPGELDGEFRLKRSGQEKALLNAPVFVPRRDLIDADLALLLLSDSIRHDSRPDIRPLLIAAVAQAPTMLRTYLRPTPEQVAKLTGYVARPWAPPVAPPAPPAAAADNASERTQRLRAERAAGIRNRWWTRKKSDGEAATGAAHSEATAAIAVASTLALFKVDAEDGAGNTLLHLAAREGDEESVAFLLANGADPQRVNREGDTVLHLAARNPNPSPLYTVLKTLPGYVRRALLAARNKAGRTALEEAARRVGETRTSERGADPRTATRSSLWYVHQVLLQDQLELDGLGASSVGEGIVEGRPADARRISPPGALAPAIPAGRFVGVDSSTGLMWFESADGAGFESFDPKHAYARAGGAAELYHRLASQLAEQTEGVSGSPADAFVNPHDYLVRLTRKDPATGQAVAPPATAHPFVWARKKAPAFIGVLLRTTGSLAEFQLPSGQRHSLPLADLAEDQAGKLGSAKELAGEWPTSPLFWRAESEGGRARTFSARLLRIEVRAMPAPQLPPGVPAPTERVAVFGPVKSGSPEVQAGEEAITLRELDARSREKAEKMAAVLEKFYTKSAQQAAVPSVPTGRLEGTLIGIVGSDVVLKNADGKIESVSFFDLTDADGERVRALVRKSNAALAAGLKAAMQTEAFRR